MKKEKELESNGVAVRLDVMPGSFCHYACGQWLAYTTANFPISLPTAGREEMAPRTLITDSFLAALPYSFLTGLVPPCISNVIQQAEKFLKCDWQRPVVFKPNLKYM